MMAVEKKVATPWQIYKRLLGYARRYQFFLALGFLGMVVEASCAAVFTWLMKPIVDETIIAQNPEVSLTLPLAIVGLFLVRGIATFVTDYGMARSGRSVVRDLRTAVLKKYLHIPSSRFDNEPVPMMVSRLNYDTESVNQSTSEAIKVVVTDTLSIIGQLAVMLYYSPIVTLTMLVIAPLIAGISGYVSRRYRRLNRSIQEGVANLAHSAEETLAAQQEVKIYGAQEKANERYTALANKNLGLSLKVEVTRASASSVVQLLAAVALSIILIVAGRQAAANNLTAGAFVAIVLAMMAMLPSLKRITNVQSPIQRGIAAAERLFGVLDEPEEQDNGTVALTRAIGHIEFRNVSMRYSNQATHALNEVSFIANPGTVTAIVGRSGSGKSTLIRLLPRFYEANSGQIILDGVSISDYRLNDLRRQIALVGQKVMLFDDTIAANIAYGSDVTDEQEIRRAADAANASEFINKLPMGLQTRIGDNGSLLSGGQRQRLAIARALIVEPSLLVLDEPTSALDVTVQKQVLALLQRLQRERGLSYLLITHDVDVISAMAHAVVVMKDGAVVESGNVQQVLQNPVHPYTRILVQASA